MKRAPTQTSFAALTFPYRPYTLWHRHGGRIEVIKGIAHCICRAAEGHSKDYWFFECEVVWDDGSRSHSSEVTPIHLAAPHPGENEELKKILRAMMEYLSKEGVWNSTPPHEGWWAHRPKERVPNGNTSEALSNLEDGQHQELEPRGDDDVPWSMGTPDENEAARSE